MFSEIDKIIFPDSCEVIQVSSQQFVYPIFKNGRSSLTQSVEENGWKILHGDKISRITDPITVYLRNPKERFISGVNTYIQHLTRNNPALDIDTILFFINEYLFLNRHYSPQFFWLLNLAKNIKPTTPIALRDYRDIAELTWRNADAEITPITKELQNKINDFNWGSLELYFFLDQQLIDAIGKTLTIKEILTNLKTSQPELYKLVFANTINLTNVLPKT